jgi:hypothetical protein
MAVEPAVPEASQTLVTLPLLGATTVEDVVFYAAVGGVAWAGLVSWPTASLFGTAHALHQRARNVTRLGIAGQVRAGLLEAADEVA